MSIRSIQISSVLGEIAEALFASGVQPTLEQILGQMAQYFSSYQAGNPLPLPFDYIQTGLPTDVNKFNLLFAHAGINVDVAYQACLEQTSQIMMLTQVLQSNLRRLKSRRNALSTKLDDYLLSLANTSDFFYSVSDNFADTIQTDLTLTSAVVDTVNQDVALPGLSSLSQIINPSNIGEPTITVLVNGVSSTNFKVVSPLTFSTNGLSNTAWEVQVYTTVPSEVVLTCNIPINNQPLSEVDIDPYGIKPVQVSINAGQASTSTGAISYAPFGNVATITTPATFLAGTVTTVANLQLVLRKTQYDYTTPVPVTQVGVGVQSGPVTYTYIFGAKNLVLTQKTYDNAATWVSAPLVLSSDIASDVVIDAVALDVTASLPASTNINYFVATDPGNTQTLSDFNWRPIAPLGSQDQNINTIVNFNGAQEFQTYIRSNPGSNDLQLLPLNETNTNLLLRNPSPSIVPAVDVYELANFTDTPLLNSLLLEEGINTTRIYSTTYNASAVKDLNFWSTTIATDMPTLQFGRIDTGHGFFYGGDVGSNGLSVYVETYLYVSAGVNTVNDILQKADQNSQTWTIKAYLNGAQVGYLPGRNTDTIDPPVDNLRIPWNFQQGLNHVALTINIPPVSSVIGISNPYIGTVQLMEAHNLFQFGTVKLSNWTYVDFFDLQYNTVGSPQTYTIYNNQIISRRQPTDNYRLTYNKPSGQQINALRLRADLNRDQANINITPQLKSYRLKFSYGNNQ